MTDAIGTPNTYTVAVRALCEFTAKAGDLDLRFTPSPTAQEGIAGSGGINEFRGQRGNLSRYLDLTDGVHMLSCMMSLDARQGIT